MIRMIEPRGAAVNDSLPNAAPAPPAASSPSGSSSSRRPDRQLGDRVRSLSLARVPERRSTLALAAAWILGTIVVAAGGWYGYTHYMAAKPTDGQSAQTNS